MPKLNYGGILCVSANKKQLEKLPKIQNRALWIACLCNCYTSNYSLHVKTHVLPLFLRRKFEIYQMMFSRMKSSSNIKNLAPGGCVTRYGVAKPPVFDTPKTTKFINSITCPRPCGPHCPTM